MNIKLQKLITLFEERKNFFNNHPDTYQFIKKFPEMDFEEGTTIQIVIKDLNRNCSNTEIVLDNSDMKFINSMKDLLA